jgi:mannosyltransferase
MRVLPSLVMAAAGLWGIGGASYWRDEAATLTAVHRSFGQLVVMLGHVDAVHGLYYLVMWPLVRVAGAGEVVTRLPSVVAMAVAAGLVAALGRRLVSPATGLAAGLIFAILPPASKYAQDARAYAMVIMLAAAASYLLVRAIGSTGRRRGWLAGYAACIGVMGALDAFALPLIVAHAVTVGLALLRADGGRIWPGAPGGEPGRGAGSLAAGWLAAVAAAVAFASPILVLGFAQRGTLGWIRHKPQGLGAVQVSWQVAGPGGLVVAALVVAAAGLAVSALGGLARLRAGWPWRLTALCLPWLLVPPAVLIGLSFLTPVFTTRYILYCLPALALLAGAGLTAACRPLKTMAQRQPQPGLPAAGWAVGAAALVAVAAFGFGSQLKIRGPGGQGDNLRRADQIVAANRLPGDALIITGGSARHVPDAYPYGLAQLKPVSQAQNAVAAGNLNGTVAPPAVVRQRLAGVNRVWLVAGRGVPRAGILDGLGFRRLQRWRVGSFWLVLYQHGRP